MFDIYLSLVQVIIGIIILILLDLLYKYTFVFKNSDGIDIAKTFHTSAFITWIILFFAIYFMAAKKSNTTLDALMNGAALGFFIYGIYNAPKLGNAISMISINTTGVGKAIEESGMDIVWGSALCAMMAVGLSYAQRK